ncbi:MAG TPA: DNA primase, partial [Campylobacterales bacterium]|nr:DNA primase [Campylobacterales bacterium]
MAYKDITIEELKQSLDILQVAQMYGELVKSGSNYVYKDDRSITISPSKQIFSNFNGEITGGSVLDLVCYMENLSIADGIKRL